MFSFLYQVFFWRGFMRGGTPPQNWAGNKFHAGGYPPIDLQKPYKKQWVFLSDLQKHCKNQYETHFAASAQRPKIDPKSTPTTLQGRLLMRASPTCVLRRSRRARNASPGRLRAILGRLGRSKRPVGATRSAHRAPCEATWLARAGQSARARSGRRTPSAVISLLI